MTEKGVAATVYVQPGGYPGPPQGGPNVMYSGLERRCVYEGEEEAAHLLASCRPVPVVLENAAMGRVPRDRDAVSLNREQGSLFLPSSKALTYPASMVGDIGAAPPSSLLGADASRCAGLR